MPKGVYKRKRKAREGRAERGELRRAMADKVVIPASIRKHDKIDVEARYGFEKRELDIERLNDDIENLKRQIELKDKLIMILVQWGEYENLI